MMKKMSSIDTVLLTSCMLCILDNFLASMRITSTRVKRINITSTLAVAIMSSY